MLKKSVIFTLSFMLIISSLAFSSEAAKIQYGPTIASAYARAYAVSDNGDLYYWGKSTYNNTNGDQSPERASPVKTLSGVTAVYGSWWSGFAIRSDNSLWALANCADAQGGIKDDMEPPIKIMDDVVQVACAYNDWAALKTDGTVWYWNYSGEPPHKVLDGMPETL